MVTKAPVGLTVARQIKSLGVARGNVAAAAAYAAGQGWDDSTPMVEIELRSAVTALSRQNTGVFVDSPRDYDLAEYVRPMTLLGRLRGVRPVPFMTRALRITGGSTASYSGEPGAAIPAGVLAIENGVVLQGATTGTLVVMTAELMRSSAPNAEQAILADVGKAVVASMDSAFIDLDNAGASNGRPASITHNAPAFASTGSSIAAIDSDLQVALRSLTDSDISLDSAAWMMRPRTAAYLASLRGTGGAPAFPGVTARGGELLGLPVLTSTSIRSNDSPEESYIVLVAADEVLLADEGATEISVSEQASVQLDSAPSAGAANLVSLFQMDLVGVLAKRVANWVMRRPEGVVLITGIRF